MKIFKPCEQCNSSFLADEKEIKRGGGKYCSRKCFGLAHRGTKIDRTPNTTCAYCEKTFYRAKNKQVSELSFCTRSCKELAQRLSSSILVRKDRTGAHYRSLAFDLLEPKCNKCDYNKITDILQVHHLDKDRTNNTIENLEILCPTCHEVAHYESATGKYTYLRK